MPDSLSNQMVLDTTSGALYCDRNVIPITKLTFPQGHQVLYRVIRRFKYHAVHDSSVYQGIDYNKLILAQIVRELTRQFPGEYAVECIGPLVDEWWDYFKHHAEPEIVFVLVFKSAWERDWWVLRWL